MSGEQIKQDYRRTEVGIIPDDWSVDTVESVTPRGGKFGIVDGPFGSNLKTIHYRKSGIPIITSGYVTEGRFYADSYLYVDKEKFEQEKRSAVKAGDIVMAKIGARCGASAILPNRHEIGILSGNALKITVDQSRHDTRYIWQSLWNLYSTGRLDELRTVGAQPAISMANLKNYKLPLPHVHEQRSIATALSDVDALLAKLDQLIAKKRDLKQATMQQLLTGQTRLPGFSRAWEIKRLKALGTTYGGLSGKTKYDFGRGQAHYIPFMNVMTDAVIDPNWLEQVDVSPNEAQNSVKKGDLFFNGSSETPEEVGYCSVLMEDISDLYLNSFCFGFRFNADAKVSRLFFAYWFRCEQGRKAMSVLAQGATRYNISKSAFLQLEISQPSVDEQTAIATVLSDIDAEIATLEARRDKTRALKQGMMQELLTGRIRLLERR